MLNIFKSKKIISFSLAMVLIMASLPIFSAFEAHIVNVTATIDNPVFLEYPNGGEVLPIGECYTIKWTADESLSRLGSVSSIDLYYSTDSGNTYPNENKITTIYPDGGIIDNCYKWKVPNDPTDQGRIMVLAHYNGIDAPDQVDYSDENFDIACTADENTAALWHFNENSGNTASDETGNNNDGTLNYGTGGSNTSYADMWTFGKYKNALSFDGTDDYVNCGNDTSLKPTSEITVEAWVYWNEFFQDSAGHAFINHNNGTNTGYMMYQSCVSPYNRIKVFLVTENGIKMLHSNPLLTKTWYHIAMVYDGNKLKLYVDEILEAETNQTGLIKWTEATDLFFGTTYSPTRAKFNGIIDEVRISNIARDFNIDCDNNGCDDEGDGGDPPADPVSPEEGDVVINEIMQDPSAVSDANGEWFELYNTSDKKIELSGCIIQDNGSDDHTIDSSLIIESGEYAVLARNDDFSANGGVNVDYEYSSFTLGNGDDEIILTCGENEIDRVEYDGGPNFPDPTGASMILIDFNPDNNNGNYWCISGPPFYGDGDYGTPGAVNSSCPE